MTDRQDKTRTSREGEILRPDPALGRLLSTLDPPADILAWSKAERLVANAPPVQLSWAEKLVIGPTVRWRYALAPVAALLLVAVLWIMPAQSYQLGTLVLTKLPVAWEVGGPAYQEVETAAHEYFAALSIPQSELYVFVKLGEDGEYRQLALGLVGAGQQQAEAFVTTLTDRFPVLGAVEPQYTQIETKLHDNRLEELAMRIAQRSDLSSLDDNALKVEVLKTLIAAGCSDIELAINRRADGTVVIVVDATMPITVTGHTREELAASGLNPELLGHETFEQLLEQVLAPTN